jgi:transcriptional regulator of acetoin/glycerol metabolism
MWLDTTASIQMWIQPSYDSSRRYLCICNHNYHTITVTTASIQMKKQPSCGLYSEVIITTMRSSLRQPVHICKQDNHTTTTTTTINWPPARRLLCRGKHNYHTTMVTTASKQMKAQLSTDHHQDGFYTEVNATIKRPRLRRSWLRCKQNYRATMVTTASKQM